jgi:hypothetical protein
MYDKLLKSFLEKHPINLLSRLSSTARASLELVQSLRTFGNLFKPSFIKCRQRKHVIISK